MSYLASYLLRILVASEYVFVAAGLLVAQTAAAPRFEVATIKRSEPDTSGPLIGISAGRLTLTGFTLKELMVFGYWIHPSQVVGAAGWMDADKFDIVAKPDESQVPPGGRVPDDVLRQMLQVLLADRFKLNFHDEVKQLPVTVTYERQ
jgi:uncharacterized protein (TIGR03435 family)